MNHRYSFILSLTAQCLAGVLFWTLPLNSVSTVNAESVEFVDPSQQPVYSPRRGELRRCMDTDLESCVFENNTFPTVPPIARDLSLDYRKSAFLAEISVKLAATGEYDQAKAFTQVITFPLSRVSALTAIAAQQAETQPMEQAQQTLAEAAQIAQTGQFNGSFRPRALTQVAVQYAAMGQSETADQFFDLALQPDPLQPIPGSLAYLRGEQLGDVAVGLLATGRSSQAEQLVNQLLQDAQGEDVILPISPSFLEPLLTAGEHDFATRLVQTIDNPTYRTRWLSEICLSLVDFGEYDRAFQLAQSIQSADLMKSNHVKQNPTPQPPPLRPLPQPSLQPPSLPSIPSVQLAPPQSEDCLRSLQDQRTLVDPANSAISLMADGETSTAIAIARMIPSHPYRMLTLTEIAIALAEAGEVEQSEQLLSQALETVATVDQMANATIDYGQGLGKMQIAVRLAESKQFARALEITETIEEDSYKVLSLLNIAEQYIQAGENEKALELLLTTIEVVGALQCTVCA